MYPREQEFRERYPGFKIPFYILEKNDHALLVQWMDHYVEPYKGSVEMSGSNAKTLNKNSEKLQNRHLNLEIRPRNNIVHQFLSQIISDPCNVYLPLRIQRRQGSRASVHGGTVPLLTF